MDERDFQTEQPLTRRVVDQVRPRIGKLRERRTEVRDLVGDVMHARSALRQEAADGRVPAERLEQLDASLADPERRRSYTLVSHRGLFLQLGPEETPVRDEREVQIVDRNAEVMDPARLHGGDASGGVGEAPLVWKRDDARHPDGL